MLNEGYIPFPDTEDDNYELFRSLADKYKAWLSGSQAAAFKKILNNYELLSLPDSQVGETTISGHGAINLSLCSERGTYGFRLTGHEIGYIADLSQPRGLVLYQVSDDRDAFKEMYILSKKAEPFFRPRHLELVADWP